MNSTITQIEMALLEGKRVRAAGSNARLGYHGDLVRLPIVRLTTSDGAAGFGRCSVPEHQLAALLGMPVADLVSSNGVAPEWLAFELPLLDLGARIAGHPVDTWLAGGAQPDRPRRVRSYDTSLYFDDLAIERDDEAAALIADEARDGWDLGHRAFKIKVGRGARHMPLEAGMRRDIAIIRAVRDAVGPEATVMIDANNGWNLNLTKRVLSETADAALYWVEEAFHEDNVLYEDLHAWIAQEGLGVRIADGEGVAHPAVLDWTRDGLIDVLQYNIFGYGFGRWAAVGAELAAKGAAVSPHTYGGGISPHVSAYLAMLTDAVQFVEWDAAIFPSLDTSAYRITDGWVSLPDAPGFGFALDNAAFAAAVRDTGLTLTV